MASSGSGYDLGATTFSPDGRIFQVEYASKAVDGSGTAMGIHCSDGIVVCVEKIKQSKMLVETSGRRVHRVNKGSGIALTGFVSDGRQIIERAREESSSYIDTYGFEIPPPTLADRVGQYVHYFTLHGALRPFGSVAIVASYDDKLKEAVSGSCWIFFSSNRLCCSLACLLANPLALLARRGSTWSSQVATSSNILDAQQERAAKVPRLRSKSSTSLPFLALTV